MRVTPPPLPPLCWGLRGSVMHCFYPRVTPQARLHPGLQAATRWRGFRIAHAALPRGGKTHENANVREV